MKSPKPIVYVGQQDDATCGVACVAMLCGVTFDDAKAVMWRGEQTYTSATRLIEGLRHFGATCPNRLIEASDGFRYRSLTVDAVLNVWRPAGAPLSVSHWVVWDVAIGDFHDPWHHPYTRLQVGAYLPVIRP